MAVDGAHNIGKASRPYKPKVKTGCLTCRKRRIKCDEAKPLCRKCSSTGRKCDGYEPEFVNSGPTLPARQATAVRAASARHPVPVTSTAHSLHNTQTLASQLEFLHKPLQGLSYTCEAEATGILISARTDPAVRYALLSMSVLRQKYAKYGDYATIKSHHAHELKPVYESYNSAIGVLTRRLSHGGLAAAEAALQCCQLFISIEVMQHNYAAAMQHLAQGLRIMRDWRSRAYMDGKGELLPPDNPTLPQIDMFALKLFFAPCPGSRKILQNAKNGRLCLPSFERTILAMVKDPERTKQIRTGKLELHEIANQVFDFLSNTASLHPKTYSLYERKVLLIQQLEIWKTAHQNLTQEDGMIWPVRVDEVAMFLFYQLLRTIVTQCLCFDEDTTAAELEIGEVLKISSILTQIRARDIVI